MSEPHDWMAGMTDFQRAEVARLESRIVSFEKRWESLEADWHDCRKALADAIKESDGYLEGNRQTLRALQEANEIAARYKRQRDEADAGWQGEAKENIDLFKQLVAMRKQRDEARGWLRDACAEIARIEARFYDALPPQRIAERNGWNCFDENEGGGA